MKCKCRLNGKSDLQHATQISMKQTFLIKGHRSGVIQDLCFCCSQNTAKLGYNEPCHAVMAA